MKVVVTLKWSIPNTVPNKAQKSKFHKTVILTMEKLFDDWFSVFSARKKDKKVKNEGMRRGGTKLGGCWG